MEKHCKVVQWWGCYSTYITRSTVWHQVMKFNGGHSWLVFLLARKMSPLRDWHLLGVWLHLSLFVFFHALAAAQIALARVEVPW